MMKNDFGLGNLLRSSLTNNLTDIANNPRVN